MLLDYQSGNPHNTTTRIYEKTATRVSAVGTDVTTSQRQVSLLSPGLAGTNLGGQHDMIYQTGNPQLGVGGNAAYAPAAASYSTVATNPVDTQCLNMNGAGGVAPTDIDSPPEGAYDNSGSYVSVGLKLV